MNWWQQWKWFYNQHPIAPAKRKGKGLIEYSIYCSYGKVTNWTHFYLLGIFQRTWKIRRNWIEKL